VFVLTILLPRRAEVVDLRQKAESFSAERAVTAKRTSRSLIASSPHLFSLVSEALQCDTNAAARC